MVKPWMFKGPALLLASCLFFLPLMLPLYQSMSTLSVLATFAIALPLSVTLYVPRDPS